MTEMIYNPLEEFEKKFEQLHLKYTNSFFQKLVKQSGINIAENKKTVKLYNECLQGSKKLKRKYNWLRVLRVVLCILIVTIPIVIWKLTPKIKLLREEIANMDQKAAELLKLAYEQMAPLNSLFTDRDGIHLIEKTIPNLDFDLYFDVKQEMDMKTNFDFVSHGDEEQSTLDTLAGRYNGNPFLLENKKIHTMGMETYDGYKTITWTEYYTDSDGRRRSRLESETLHATVTKPKPFYHTQVVLNYGAQGAPDLSFSRDASHLQEKSERQIERLVKKGSKKLKRKTDKAIEENKDFVSMSNTDFEVLFDALDRDNEVQFRTMFTPLAQTNMVDLLLSQTGYGDDFHFIKRKRMNKIVATHSQDRDFILDADGYKSYSYDIIKDNFIKKNVDYFKAVYFDFAPIWAVPMYQEEPVSSLKPLPDYKRLYAAKECEALTNAIDERYVVHPNTKTEVILKHQFINTQKETDEILVTAYSYDIEQRADVVSVYGRDGRFHNVTVPWDEYIPLEANETFFITKAGQAKKALASRNGLCIFQ